MSPKQKCCTCLYLTNKKQYMLIPPSIIFCTWFQTVRGTIPPIICDLERCKMLTLSCHFCPPQPCFRFCDPLWSSSLKMVRVCVAPRDDDKLFTTSARHKCVWCVSLCTPVLLFGQNMPSICSGRIAPIVTDLLLHACYTSRTFTSMQFCTSPGHFCVW